MRLGYLQAQDTLQTITLDECYQLAEQNYPLVRQYDLNQKSAEYSLSNAKKGRLPQLQIAGQASYQSDVTQIPISLPQLNIPTLNKDQYRLYAEISQSLTDIWTRQTPDLMINANTAIENQKTKVNLYQVRARLDQLYFGILLIDAQLAQVRILTKDIHSGIAKDSVAIANGVALKSSADELQAALLSARQQEITLTSIRSGYTEMLSYFIGKPVGNKTMLKTPEIIPPGMENHRPELKLFALQENALEVQRRLIHDKNLPRISLFLQGGIGKPGLNMLDDDLSPYYIGGLRLQWNLSNLYTRKNENQQLNLNKQQIAVQQDVFLFNTNLQLRQQNQEIVKFDELISTDLKIIDLREKIRLTAQHQLENGTTTSHDYLSYVYDIDKSRQDLALHQLQKLIALYKIKNTLGN
jgi:outer membrane protein TolC